MSSSSSKFTVSLRTSPPLSHTHVLRGAGKAVFKIFLIDPFLGNRPSRPQIIRRTIYLWWPRAALRLREAVPKAFRRMLDL